MRRLVWTIGLAAMAMVLAPTPVPAQSTPTAEQCEIAPLDRDELREIVESGFEPAPELVETGDPASAQDLVAIFDVLTESVACTNANRPMSALALFSDRYLAERFSGPDGEDELGHLLAAATRSPGPAESAERLVLLAVTDPVRYSDGRIGAMATTANAEAVFEDLIIFVETDDGWRIDQVILGEDIAARASPTAASEEP